MAPTLYDEKPEAGDLIEIFRGPYQHWAVYVGDGLVVHFTLPQDSDLKSMLRGDEMAMVRKDKLSDVVGGDKWEINNSLDEKNEPRPAHDIVKEACAKMGEEKLYILFGYNCEHFATEMRYGKAESPQVHDLIETIAEAGLATVVGTLSRILDSKKEKD